MKFQIGDRVATYKANGRIVGTVEEATEDVLMVRLDENMCLIPFHPKQCRRLKPKAKPRRIWISPANLREALLTRGTHICVWNERAFEDQIEFVEVHK